MVKSLPMPPSLVSIVVHGNSWSLLQRKARQSKCNTESYPAFLMQTFIKTSLGSGSLSRNCNGASNADTAISSQNTWSGWRRRTTSCVRSSVHSSMKPSTSLPTPSPYKYKMSDILSSIIGEDSGYIVSIHVELLRKRIRWKRRARGWSLSAALGVVHHLEEELYHASGDVAETL